MNITISGKTHIPKRILKEAIPFMMKALRYEKQSSEINLTLKFKDLKNFEGLCDMIDRKSFEIYISNRFGKHKTALILAHEIVHLWQFARRKLDFIGEHGKFQGKFYDLRKIHYYDLPWELEAFALQEGLVAKFVEHKQSKNKKKAAKSKTCKLSKKLLD